MPARRTQFLYRPANAALLRAAVAPLDAKSPAWPAPHDLAEQRSWLGEILELPDFTRRLRHSHPAVFERLCRAQEPSRLDAKGLGKLARTIARYVLRERGRPTPFGLWAGVGPVEWGDASVSAVEGRAFARADASWLHEVISLLERDPRVGDALTVMWDNRATVRGDRVLLRCGAGQVAVWHTSVVASVRRAAALPVALGELVSVAAAAAPGHDAAAKARALVRELVELGFLITSLRPSSTCPDPLGYVLEVLDRAGIAPSVADETTQTVSALTLVAGTLRRHNHEAAHAYQPELRERLDSYMRGTHAASGRATVAIDLRLNTTVTVPIAVAREMAAAADALMRLSGEPDGAPDWRVYHRRFIDRFGTETAVPLLDLVDPDVGLGYPAEYPESVIPPEPPPRPGDRDALLLALAADALAADRHEVVLTEAKLAACTPPWLETASYPAHIEVAARVQAASAAALNAGDFTLLASPAAAAGTLTGRFAACSPDSGLADLFRSLPTQVAGGLPVQLSFPARVPRLDNITQVPAHLPHLLVLGEHPASIDDAVQVLLPDDVAVFATADALHLVHVPLGRVIEPRVFHALALEAQAHPLVRFLERLPRAFGPRMRTFAWGPAADRFTRLPRLRYRRTILRPSRWYLTGDTVPPKIPATEAGARTWHQDLTAWRTAHRCPDVVELHEEHRPLRLDLNDAFQADLLRRHLLRHGHAYLTETGDAADLGWLGGVIHELVVPMVATGLPRPAPPLPTTSIHVTKHGHAPGTGTAAWISAHLTAHPHRHAEIIARHLPRLRAQLNATEPGGAGLWFIRYRSGADGDHLRLRVPAEGFGARRLRLVAAWAEDLRTRRIAGGLRLDTYRPENGRYGTGQTMDAAEAVFACDTAAVAAQLAHPPHPSHTAVTAAGMAAMAMAFLGVIDARDMLDLRWIPPIPRGTPCADRGHTIHAAELAVAAVTGDWSKWHPETAAAWQARAAALTAYRRSLPAPPQATGIAVGDLDAYAVAGALLHMHHNRAAGLDPLHEAACLRAARYVLNRIHHTHPEIL